MDWDSYFLKTCKVIGAKSKCLSRQIGAILVRDKVIICTGYNGPPRGVPHCNERYFNDPYLISQVRPGQWYDEAMKVCPRKFLGFKSGEGLQFCNAAHAERNCLIQAARLGIATKEATLYMDCPIPCGDCLIEIINAGVKEVVTTSLDLYDQKSEFLLNNSQLVVRTFEGVVDAGY